MLTFYTSIQCHIVNSKFDLVCKLALHSKYPKYESDGFTALYTRPPVIYISSAAPPEFSKQLQNQVNIIKAKSNFVF